MRKDATFEVMAGEHIQLRTIALMAVALLLLAGCESVPKDASQPVPGSDCNEPAAYGAPVEPAPKNSATGEPNTPPVPERRGATVVTSDRPDAGSSTPHDTGRATERESPQFVAAGNSGVRDRQADTTSTPRVRIIQPVATPLAQVEARAESAKESRTGAQVRSAPEGACQTGAAGETGAASPSSQDHPPAASNSSADSLKSPSYRSPRPPALANADSIVKLDLPPQLEMVQLLDLVGEYLQLDYLYDPEKLKGQTVSLKLHGKLQGEVCVRDLYLLLESVLKFKGLAMTCSTGNLVTVVPATDALKANPDLVDPNGGTLDAGDVVVTDIFDLHHVSVSAASTLLQNLQLSLATTPLEGASALIVTCYAHQIERIERLLRLVDRPGTPREFRFRQLKYTLADALTRKVQVLLGQLGNVAIAGATGASSPARMVAVPGGPAKPGSTSGGPPSAEDGVYLDADERTNRILMIGTREQLAVVDKLVDSLDVGQQDLRVLKIYDIRHVEAQEVKKKLQELEILGEGGHGRTASVGLPNKIGGSDGAENVVAERPVVVALETTNALVINATEEQHARVEAMLPYLDAAVRTETIPYEIYFLENQDPTGVAEVLEKIIHETVPDKDGKVQKIVRNTEEQIVIVPDKNTFSLIVYAARKNQEWISKLIETLDRRRPQVLIDVTLAEIRKTDEFTYDLNLITSVPNLLETAGQTGQFYAAPNTTVVDKLVQTGRTQFVDAQIDSGTGTGFYGDRHINALLKAVQTKNYGRVLAKPKVLVNDNEKGTIKTADTTYVVTKSSVPVTNGTAGQQNTLIETAVKYEPYDAGITLEITPHISEKVLRLEIKLNRSDFTTVTAEKPPDETSSDISTIVTVPDRSTIILGGMLRLNQTKSGSKVPILGDLPLIGGIFRSVSNSDIQSKLYIFVRAEVIRPPAARGSGPSDIEVVSQRDRDAFETHEREFQRHQDWPGIDPKPVDPKKVLEAR